MFLYVLAYLLVRAIRACLAFQAVVLYKCLQSTLVECKKRKCLQAVKTFPLSTKGLVHYKPHFSTCFLSLVEVGWQAHTNTFALET